MENWKALYDSFKRLNNLTDEDMAALYGTNANALRNNSALPRRFGELVRILESGVEQAWTYCHACGHRTPDFAQGEETCENCGKKFSETRPKPAGFGQ